MNLFVLDDDITTSVQYYTNKHVVKMILETAQMLSTAHRILDGDDIDPVIYKKTHWNHPCSKWMRETTGNYSYGYNLFSLLAKEYQYRYNKNHLSWRKLQDVLKTPPKNIDESLEMTPFALAMPDEYKTFDSAVESYRKYYIGEKSHLFTWTRRQIPTWITKTLMPIYNYHCNKCGHEFEGRKSIEDRHWNDPCPSCGTTDEGTVSIKIGVSKIVREHGDVHSKTDMAFRDNLKRIKQHNPRSNIKVI